jgi:hypothetical protein
MRTIAKRVDRPAPEQPPEEQCNGVKLIAPLNDAPPEVRLELAAGGQR